MTAVEHAAELDTMGPVGYLIVEFPGNKMTGEAFPILLDLVDRGIVRILDLAFVRKELDGRVTTISQIDLERMKVLEAAVFEGAASGLLGQDDLDEAAKALEPNSSAAVLVYENVWAAPFAAALRRSGAQLVATGQIPIQALLEALNDTETAG